MNEDILIVGDVYAGLNYLRDDSIAVAITSPPYWKQRDYRFRGQVGQERSPEEYIGRLVAIYNKLYQKLRKDSVFFLNIGDKYFSQYGKSHLLQIPYRLAYHMVKGGWYLEDIIIWYKPNHMPSSVRDRFTNTYEPVLVLAKSTKNIYKKKKPNVVEISLQQTPWRHTAVYPESLVKEMLNRVELKDGDLVLDPFAGTGTTATVVKTFREQLYSKRISSILIERGTEFIDIIEERAGIGSFIKVEEASYEWRAVEEDDMPGEIGAIPVTKDKHGEVHIVKNHKEFLSSIKGVATEEFKGFHREDALYFFGVKEWKLDSLYYIQSIYEYGFVLRNMLVVSNGNNWYPIFVFANDSTKVAYKFYLDRVRLKTKAVVKKDWTEKDITGMKVRDISGKTTKDGCIVKILNRYKDGFPRIVVVQWNGTTSIELVIHPEKDEFLMEGALFFCPGCDSELTEPYDSIGDNLCPSCGKRLWTSLDTVPLIREPQEILEAAEELENNDYSIGQVLSVEDFRERKVPSSSKFISLDRVNWGASPGARKLMLGEYFTKMRLYRIDQPAIAQYLILLRKSKNISIQNITSKLPEEYFHTVGHWFRKDFGGSIPIPEDIGLIKTIFGIQDGLLKIIERTALKLQTVKASVKGKNPGDYIKNKDDEELLEFLRMLYIPSSEYIATISKKERAKERGCFKRAILTAEHCRL